MTFIKLDRVTINPTQIISIEDDGKDKTMIVSLQKTVIVHMSYEKVLQLLRNSGIMIENSEEEVNATTPDPEQEAEETWTKFGCPA